MNVQDFINQYKGRAWDFDGYYGAQCVDLVQFFAKWLGYGRFTGNAIDLWNQAGSNYVQIPNTPSFVPQAGDIAVWGRSFGNGYGHVGICTGNGNRDWFESLDANWGDSRALVVRHNYVGFLGVLRPKKLIPAPVPAPHVAAKRLVKVTLPNLQVRVAPNVTAAGNKANTPDGMLHAGMVVEVAGEVDGQQVTINGVTSNKWAKSVRGNYFWLGGTQPA